MPRRHCLDIVGVFLLATTASSMLPAADPPKIERFVPAGGQRGTTVDVKLPGKPGDGDLKVWSKRNQLQLEFSEKKDSARLTIPADASVGQHWMRFHNEFGATDLLPFVVGVLPDVVETEPNDQLLEASVVEPLPRTINGVLEKSGDTDVYAVTLKQADTLVASVDANHSLGSPMDAVLQLLDSSGTVISQNDDDHGFDPKIVFEVPKDDTYFIRIFAFPATPNSTIKLAGAASFLYRLTLTTGPFIDHCIPAEVAANTDTTVTLFGWNLDENLSTVHVPAFEGESIPIGESTALPYVVTRTQRPALAERPGTRQQIPVPSSVTGVVSEPNESDVYTFTGKKDQKLTISVAAQSLNSPLDPSLSVDIADGKRMKDADDRSRDDRDAEVSIKLPADGEYSITVEDLFGNGGKRYVYVLAIRETQPDFSLTLKANSFRLEQAKELEIPVAIARTNGFAEIIAVNVDGLPDGVTVEAVDSEGKGETAKSVTLKLKRGPDSMAYSGVVTVTGHQREGNESRVAEAPIANSTVTTKQIWLTVLAPPSAKKDDKKIESPKESKP